MDDSDGICVILECICKGVICLTHIMPHIFNCFLDIVQYMIDKTVVMIDKCMGCCCTEPSIIIPTNTIIMSNNESNTNTDTDIIIMKPEPQVQPIALDTQVQPIALEKNKKIEPQVINDSSVINNAHIVIDIEPQVVDDASVIDIEPSFNDHLAIDVSESDLDEYDMLDTPNTKK